MSVKIFNGYKLTNIDICTLNQFYLELKKEIAVIARKKYFKQIADEAIETLDNLLYLKHSDFDKFKKVLITLQKRSNHMVNVYHNYVYNKENPNDDALFKSAAERLFLVLINDAYINDVEEANIRMHNDIDLDFSYSICVMPLSNENILFTAYGSELLELLDNKCKNDKEFCKKYGLSKYWYFNNTDRPDEISEEDWEKRKNEWDEVLDRGDGIPNKSGMGIELYDFRWDLRLREVMLNWDEFSELFPLKEDRVNKKVKDILLNEFMNNKYIEKGLDPFNLEYSDFSYSDWCKWEKEFNILYQEDKVMITKKEELTNLFNELFIDLTKENLTAKVKTIFNLGED